MPEAATNTTLPSAELVKTFSEIVDAVEKSKFHYRKLPEHTIRKFKDAAFERAFPARAIAKALAASDPSDWDN